MKNVQELTLEEKIGQLFMVGIKDDKEFKIEKLIKENKIGGVILYSRNYNNYEEMVKLVNKIKNTNKNNNIPIFISIDQEGGRVNRMPDDILNIRSATKIARTENIEIAKSSGKVMANMLKQTGISMNFAPTLDSKNKEEVSKYGIEVMKQMQEEGVIPVIKHFPGHGLTQKDSHFKIPIIEQKINELEKNDMVPFENAIMQGADAIMVGHLIIKDVDKKYPASLSKKVIEKYLIEKYNFKGIIITDDLKMMAIQLYYNMKKAVIKAIEAGNDIIMIGLPYSQVKTIIKYITKEVKNGKISIEKIDKSVQKIIDMKQKYKLNDNEVTGFNPNEINEEIEKINEEVDKTIQKI